MSDAPMQPNSPDEDFHEGSAYGEGSFQSSSNDFGEADPRGDSAGDSPFDAGAPSGEMDESSWLLEDAPNPDDQALHGDVQALPDEFANDVAAGDAHWSEDGEPASDEANGEYGVDEDLVGTSYVEPEPTSQIFSRALVPGVLVLLLSFGGIAVWASLNKEPDQVPIEPSVAALPGDEDLETNDDSDDELVVPDGASGAPANGRMGYQRDGSLVPNGAVAPMGAATVDAPREPDELPASSVEIADSNDGEVTGERASFSGFGGDSAPVVILDDDAGAEALDHADETAGDASDGGEISLEVNDYVDATEFDLGMEGGGDEPMELSQSFLDSFVLDIEPIEEETAVGELHGNEPVEMVEVARETSLDDDRPEAFNETDAPTPYFAPGFEQVFPDDPQYESYAWAFPTFDDDSESTDSSGSAESMDAFGADSQPVAAVELPPGFDADDPDFAFVPFGFFDDATASAGVEPVDEVVATIEQVELPEQEAPPVETPMEEASADEPGADVAFAPEPTQWTMEVPPGPDEDDFSLGSFEPSEQEPVADEPDAPDPVIAEVESVDPIESAESAEPVEHIATELSTEPSTEPSSVPTETPSNDPSDDIDVAAAHAKLDAIFGASFDDESFAPARPAEPEISEEFVKPEIEPEAAPESDAEPEFVDVAADQPMQPEDETGIQVEGQPIEVDVVTSEPQAEEAGDIAPEMDIADAQPNDEPTTGPVEAEPTLPSGDPTAEPAEETSSEQESESSELEVAEFVDGTEATEVEVHTNIADEAPKPKGTGILTRVESGVLWRHRTVPKAKMDDDTFTLTPNVGRVRVIFARGESIDGRLHGVGQNKIVVDTKLGRISLDARRAERIDRLGSSKRVLAAEEDSTRGLEKVRVKAPGGTFEGHLIAREGNRVTLRLDKGVRITLESDDVQPASKTGTVSRIKRLDK